MPKKDALHRYMVILSVPALVLAMALGLTAGVSRQPAVAQTQPAVDYDNIEAVLDTDMGQIIIEFFHQEAPKHVEYFVKQAKAGAYNGTTFHRLLKNSFIQGGDPLTKNVANKASYGQGGLNAGIQDELSARKHEPGAVSCVLQGDPSRASGVKPGSAGAQFLIMIANGPKLDGLHSVFGKVTEGMDVVAKISSTPQNGMIASQRVEIKKVTLREKTPTIEQMKNMSGVIETSMGSMKINFTPEGAPNTTRNFIRLAKSGLYDGTTISKISYKYFLVGGNPADWPKDSPNNLKHFSLWAVAPEITSVKHERGTLSMIAGRDGSTQFFFSLVTQGNSALDGKNIPVAIVVDGLDVLDQLAQSEVDGDIPKQRIEIKKITIQ